MTIEEKFGQILAFERKKAGLSQEALAHSCGLDRTFVSLLERGKRKPTINTIFKIAKALEIPAYQMVKKIEVSLNEDNKN